MPTTTDLITSFTWEFYADACQRTPPQHTWFHLARMQLRTAHTHKHTANAYTEIKTVLKSRHRQIFLQNVRLHMPCHATSLCTVIWNELFSEHSLFAAFICISKSLHTICKYFHVIAVPDQMHETLKKNKLLPQSHLPSEICFRCGIVCLPPFDFRLRHFNWNINS